MRVFHMSNNMKYSDYAGKHRPKFGAVLKNGIFSFQFSSKSCY
ncbi:hypothetical protein VIBNIAM115_1580027 [Vibrio nigripulchritudo AM115]|nr:hypothetical protein VIBNIAM115_1580027 [Vibrio nigripulchritudo AM115]